MAVCKPAELHLWGELQGSWQITLTVGWERRTPVRSISTYFLLSPVSSQSTNLPNSRLMASRDTLQAAVVQRLVFEDAVESCGVGMA